MHHDGAPIQDLSIIDNHTFFYKSQTVALQVLKCGGGQAMERLKRQTVTNTGLGTTNTATSGRQLNGNFFVPH